jgi:hypothetical protein
MKNTIQRRIFRSVAVSLLAVLLAVSLTSCPDGLLSTLESELETSYDLSTHVITFTSSDSAHGTVLTPDTGSVEIINGTSVEITASDPLTRGYCFSGWTCSGEGRAVFQNPEERQTSVTVYDGDVTIHAEYSLITASLEYMGQYDLDYTWHSDMKHLDTPKALVYHDGYVYIIGQNNSTARIMKIDVSMPDSPGWTARIDPADSTSATDAVDIVINNTALNIAAPGINGMTAGIIELPLGRFFADSMGVLRTTNGNDIRKIAIGYFSDFQWYVSASNGVLRRMNGNNVHPDTNIDSICYAYDYGRLFVTGNDGTDGSISTVKINPSFNPEIETNVDDVTFNNQHLHPTEMRYKPGSRYLYSVATDAGLITFYLDNAPAVSVNAVEGIDTDTGSNMVDIDSSGNYLITAGTNPAAADKYCIYDIHENNGSSAEPYLLYSGNSRGGGSWDIIAIDMDGDYLYALEKTYLRIYKLTTSTD